ELLEGLDQADHLPRLLALDAHGGRRTHGKLRRGGLDPARLERLLDAFERARRRVDGDESRLDLDVLGTGVDRRELDEIGVLALRVDLDDALLLEEPLHGSGLAELPAAAGERGPDLGDRAVPVVGRDLDHHRNAARRVSLVDDALERRGVATAGRAVDRALDVLTRHVHASRAVDRQ